MKLEPVVTIVMPIFNDATTLEASIGSALAQSYENIEIICVDDASTDQSDQVVEQVVVRDPRVRLIRQERNLSAFQARRVGIEAARGEYVLFLDGDDELDSHAVESALACAVSSGADLVGFGVVVVEKNGTTGGAYEARLQPIHRQLTGSAEVLAGLFPAGKPAQGQLWRYMYSTNVLRHAYSLLPKNVVLPRINDLPLLFLVACLATSYVSLPARLYRYHFGRGGSGQDVTTAEMASFYASAIESVDSIQEAIDRLSQTHQHASLLRETYESMRLSIIGYVIKYFVDHCSDTMLPVALQEVYARAVPSDVLRAVQRFYPGVLPSLAKHGALVPLQHRAVRRVLIVTGRLSTGGVSGVVLSQAEMLRDAGFKVAVLTKISGGETLQRDGIRFLSLTKRGEKARLGEWAATIDLINPDVILDHHVMYSRDWPILALLARAGGIPTIGWLHNFAARPIFDASGMFSILKQNLQFLAQVVVLSPLDVVFWKLQGVERAVYLPNPPSPLLLDRLLDRGPAKLRSNEPIRLIWWGRLEQRTKRVRELITVATELARLGVDFRLSVVGPDWTDLTAAAFNAEVKKHRLDDFVLACGPRTGSELADEIHRSDLFINTSIIEGYPLTLVEAQSAGLPVVMYDLPWLAIAENNDGLISVPQGDATAMAREIALIAGDAGLYSRLSTAAVTAASHAREHDFGKLYTQLISGELPSEYSPEPSLAAAADLLRLTLFFAEASSGAYPEDRGSSSPLALARTSKTRKMWQASAPAGSVLLRMFPRLRPVAHRVKRWLRAE